MNAGPTLGLALIVRDEEETLPNLLASIEGAFDQVVLVDTGSTDRTVEFFEMWATAELERNPAFRHRVGHFEWVDDFAAARNAANAFLGTDWACWADCDDTAVNATALRSAVTSVPEEVSMIRLPYDIGDPRGLHLRERLARRGSVCWAGRVHERPFVIEGGSKADAPQSAVWWRHSKGADTNRKRNLAILLRWVADEPSNPCAHQALAAEQLALSCEDAEPALLSAAVGSFRRYLDLDVVRQELSAVERDRASWAIEAIEQGADLDWIDLGVVLLRGATGRPPGFWLSRLMEIKR
jgi:glycosyltransferase involved in cell wall biosynthesis